MATTESQRQRLSIESEDNFRAFGHTTGFIVRDTEVCNSKQENGEITHRVKVPNGSNFGISNLAERMGKEIANVEIAEDGDLWFNLR